MVGNDAAKKIYIARVEEERISSDARESRLPSWKSVAKVK